MKNKEMTVQEIANRTGTTVRTLHYYDEIGLLHPSTVTESNYRLYSAEDLLRLEQILFYKNLGFSLKEVKELLEASVFTRREALRRRLELLKLQKRRLQQQIEFVEQTICGDGAAPSPGIDKALSDLQSHYRAEVIERWGDTPAYREYSEKSHGKGESRHREFVAFSDDFFSRLAQHEKLSPSNPTVQKMVAEWQRYITKNFYDCPNEMLINLAEVYVGDERFSKYINGFGSKNLSHFFYSAIKAHCKG